MRTKRFTQHTPGDLHDIFMFILVNLSNNLILITSYIKCWEVNLSTKANKFIQEQRKIFNWNFSQYICVYKHTIQKKFFEYPEIFINDKNAKSQVHFET